MASLFDKLNSSDSEDDTDYVPDDEGSSDEEEPIPAIYSNGELETKKAVKANRKEHGDKMCQNEKEKANTIFVSFLDEVKSEMSSPQKSSPESSVYSLSPLSSASSSQVSSSSSSTQSSSVNSEELFTAETSCEKPAEVVEFAGETIAITKNGTILSSDCSTVGKNSPEAAPLKRRGLQSVLGAIQSKKTRVSTLTKSALDWNTFKNENGIVEELERFNKGKGGFVERKKFLERSDARSFEFERDMRLSRIKKS